MSIYFALIYWPYKNYSVHHCTISHSQHNELAIKSAIEITLKLISNMIGDTDGNTSFPP